MSAVVCFHINDSFQKQNSYAARATIPPPLTVDVVGEIHPGPLSAAAPLAVTEVGEVSRLCILLNLEYKTGNVPTLQTGNVNPTESSEPRFCELIEFLALLRKTQSPAAPSAHLQPPCRVLEQLPAQFCHNTTA